LLHLIATSGTNHASYTKSHGLIANAKIEPNESDENQVSEDEGLDTAENSLRLSDAAGHNCVLYHLYRLLYNGYSMLYV